jgi:hypothetical protein
MKDFSCSPGIPPISGMFPPPVTMLPRSRARTITVGPYRAWRGQTPGMALFSYRGGGDQARQIPLLWSPAGCLCRIIVLSTVRRIMASEVVDPDQEITTKLRLTFRGSTGWFLYLSPIPDFIPMGGQTKTPGRSRGLSRAELVEA